MEVGSLSLGIFDTYSALPTNLPVFSLRKITWSIALAFLGCVIGYGNSPF